MDMFFSILESIGVIAFAVSGATLAIDKEIDLFGVILLALITSFGGGMIRDVLIDRTPSFFTSYFHIVCAIFTTLSIFIVAAVLKNKYLESKKTVDKINNYFDAVGLGVFSVTGAKICIELGYDSAIVAISLGMITSVGGGIIRDVCLGEIPFVLKKRIYAVASLIGASFYFVAVKWTPIPEYISLLLGVLAVIATRIIATFFKLNMPKAIIFK